jgi:hypothetical protein
MASLAHHPQQLPLRLEVRRWRLILRERASYVMRLPSQAAHDPPRVRQRLPDAGDEVRFGDLAVAGLLKQRRRNLQ